MSIDKAKFSLPLLEAALFYDLTTEKTVKISSQPERRERDLQELFRRAKGRLSLSRLSSFRGPPQIVNSNFGRS